MLFLLIFNALLRWTYACASHHALDRHSDCRRDELFPYQTQANKYGFAAFRHRDAAGGCRMRCDEFSSQRGKTDGIYWF